MHFFSCLITNTYFFPQSPANNKPAEIISYWHPNLTINLMDDQTSWTQGSVPQPLDECMYKKYPPKVVLSHFQALGSWLLSLQSLVAASYFCSSITMYFNQFHVQSTLSQTDTAWKTNMHLLHIGVIIEK